MTSYAQNQIDPRHGAIYMHTLTLAVEACVSVYSNAEIQSSATQIISLLNQGIGDVAVSEAERLSIRGYGGYAQAIGKAIHGMYFSANGETEALVLPEILRAYGSKISPRIASLARETGIVAPDLPDDRTKRLFISWIEQQRLLFSLPSYVAPLRTCDFPDLIDDTIDAMLHFYPVPVFYDAIDLEQFFVCLLKDPPTSYVYA